GDIESEEIKVRARKLKNLQVLILFERVDGIRRKTRWERSHVHAARSELSLQCVHIADYADAKRGNSRRAVPIIRICFHVDNLLRRVIALELERSGSKGVCFLRLVAVLGNHWNRDQIRQQTSPFRGQANDQGMRIRRFDAANV